MRLSNITEISPLTLLARSAPGSSSATQPYFHSFDEAKNSAK